jgi:uncharacterized protein (DUF433 family)
MTTRKLDEHIDITPGVAGGKPRIAGRRITVQNVAIWHERMGKSADEIATEYDLTRADVGFPDIDQGFFFGVSLANAAG